MSTATATVNVVIDLSHHNEKVDFKKIASAGIVGIIHKATQGMQFVDKKYAERKKLALDAGLLWGAYHFGVGGDGSDQADFFLSTVKPDPTTLLVLDYEPNVTGPTMTLGQAREFIEHTQQVTGRFPGFYSGHLIKEQLGSVTTQCAWMEADFVRLNSPQSMAQLAGYGVAYDPHGWRWPV